MVLTRRCLSHNGISLSLLDGLSDRLPLLHPPLDVIDHLLEEVLRLIDLLPPENPFVVDLLLDV